MGIFASLGWNRSPPVPLPRNGIPLTTRAIPLSSSPPLKTKRRVKGFPLRTFVRWWEQDLFWKMPILAKSYSIGTALRLASMASLYGLSFFLRIPSSFPSKQSVYSRAGQLRHPWFGHRLRKGRPASVKEGKRARKEHHHGLTFLPQREGTRKARNLTSLTSFIRPSCKLLFGSLVFGMMVNL